VPPPRLAFRAQPTRERGRQLDQHEDDDQQGGGRVRGVPVVAADDDDDCLLPVRGAEVDLSAAAAVAPLRFEFESVFDPDLLEHHLVGPVADVTPATPSVRYDKNEKMITITPLLLSSAGVFTRATRF